MMVKMMTLGVQLFVPMALGAALLIPIHQAGDYLEDTEGNPSDFMRWTLTNIQPGATVLWYVGLTG